MTAKLYAIFALLATTTLALAVAATLSARSHASLTDEFEQANTGGRNVERVSGLMSTVEAEARAIYLAPDQVTAAKSAASLVEASNRIGAVVLPMV